ncbi:methyltransferase domain-containing protein [candidate division KSB1 bacterium]|nr:methyltransferase domain-containing protein [candidate division KSB1 bacterium]
MKSSKTWINYAAFKDQRGRFIADILTSIDAIKGKYILDIGCGEGGTASLLAAIGAHMYAVDMANKLAGGSADTGFCIMNGQALGFRDQIFDFIIMQDVIEHVIDPALMLAEAKRVLKSNGTIYLCTPNRLSPLNLIADPHWNLPCVSILSRRWIKMIVPRILKIDRDRKTDWAALLSYFKLKELLGQLALKHQFVTRRAVDRLFNNPRSIVCNPLHLTMVRFLKMIRFDRALRKWVSDGDTLFNRFVNPTWYMLVYPADASHRML